MSSAYSTVRYRREALARARFEHNLRLLERELAQGAERRHLDLAVELCELLLEQTGGNLYTAEYRRQLTDAKARVEASGPHLRLVTGETS